MQYLRLCIYNHSGVRLRKISSSKLENIFFALTFSADIRTRLALFLYDLHCCDVMVMDIVPKIKMADWWQFLERTHQEIHCSKGVHILILVDQQNQLSKSLLFRAKVQHIVVEYLWNLKRKKMQRTSFTLSKFEQLTSFVSR